MPDSLTLADIEAARGRIARFVHRTPLMRSRTLSERLRTNVYLKAEVFQKTGSFKVRGAFNKMLSLGDAARERGVVAMSGGNHAQAVAYAARELGLTALIFIPEATPKNYVRATEGYGAKVEIVPTPADGFREMYEHGDRGWIVVHPFDDPLIMAGQGTTGLEIVEDVPAVTDVFVSIGGGGLVGGVATAIKSLRPAARVWGVETEGADCMSRALAAGRVVTLSAITSIARTLGAPAASETTLELARKHLETVMVVTDAEAINALRLLLERTKILTEPAASCTLAAAERLGSRFGRDDHVVLLLCGGNLAHEDLCRFA